MNNPNKPIWRLQNAPSATQDRPIEQEADDLLDRAPFVASLERALVKDIRDKDGNLVARKSTGFVVGLTGPWGSGKSSVLNLLTLRLSSQQKVIVVYFNPWLFKGQTDLLTAFFNLLGQAIGRTKREDVRGLLEALDRYREIIETTAHVAAAGVDYLGGSGAATKAVTGLLRMLPRSLLPKAPVDPLPSILNERRLLEEQLSDLDSAVVVLVDELDRVEDDDVRAVAQLVKAVGDIRGISYLVAYDPKRVADALGRGTGEERRETGNAYLEKIIQHPIPMRPLFNEDIDILINAILAVHSVNISESDRESDREIVNLLKQGVETPREVKRLIGSFKVIEEAVRGEINPTHVLAYCWILTKSPDLRNLIAAEPDKFVDDPSTDEMYRRSATERPGRPESLISDELLGKAAKPYEQMLKKLFPRFGATSENPDGMSLSRRRNLVRILYLGTPPGAITRQTVEEIWGQPSPEIESDLNIMRTSGTLAAFLDRLDDLQPQLAATGDAQFWPALSRSLTRKADWIRGPDADRSISEDAATSLFRLAVRDRSNLSRVKRAIECLIGAGDLILVPWILRKHMFQHGFAEGQPPRPDEGIFSRDETDELLKTEIPRYREALLNGTLLRRVPTVDALFALKNGGFWDSDLNESLSNQLTIPEAVYTLAALFTPPGQIVERNTIAQVVDIDQLATRVANLPLPLDPWVAESFKRFKLTVEGKDPFFDSDDG